MDIWEAWGVKFFTLEMDWYKGWWGCGYVVLPNDSLAKKELKNYRDEIEWRIDAHGGITFEMEYTGKAENVVWNVICEELYLKPWDLVLGFDTAHAFDTNVRWTRQSVFNEAKKMAEVISVYSKWKE